MSAEIRTTHVGSLPRSAEVNDTLYNDNQPASEAAGHRPKFAIVRMS